MSYVKKGSRVKIIEGHCAGQWATVLDNNNFDRVLIEVDGVLPDRSCLNRFTIKSHYLKVINTNA